MDGLPIILRRATIAQHAVVRRAWRCRGIAQSFLLLLALACLAVLAVGCRTRPKFAAHDSPDFYRTVATQIDYPNVQTCLESGVLNTPAPRTLRRGEPLEPRDLSLEEAVRMTLARSEVIRSLGARIITSPSSVSSVYDVAIQESHPLFGPEAALSDFDAHFTTSLLFNRNERTPNNAFFVQEGGLTENTGRFRADISKRAATGTLFSIGNVTDYDRNNIPVPPNRFIGAYDTAFEARVRQPLLQGAGIAFNRIAGPNARPGVYDGVLVGRVNTDIRLADFEASVRDLLMEVERTYWQLYFAYRELDARKAARDAALETWRAVESRRQAGLPGADSEREALAREQYFAAQADVDNALSGTATSGLVVTTSGGVYTVERQLRYLIGLPTNDGQLLRPSDEPVGIDVVFSWDDSLQQALIRRVELRKQRWVIKRRELELVASRNFLRAKLDVLGAYRWRGFGDDLLGNRHEVNGSAFDDLFTGDLQEWQLGLELSTPIGNRIGHTAFRHAQWNLNREVAVYEEQEREVARELSRAFAELDRAYSVSRANYNRSRAAYQQLTAIEAKYEAGLSLLEFVIDAQRRTTDASSFYFRSLVDYSTAIANVHLVRGTLLDYMNVYLAEAPWSAAAQASAVKEARRFRRRNLNYSCTLPAPVSAGPYSQMTRRPVAPAAEAVLPPIEGVPAVPEDLSPL